MELFGLRAAALALALAAAGCGRTERPAASPPSATSAALKPGEYPLPPPAVLKPPAALTPIEAGPGVLIGEPEGPAALRPFGAGCGRWLQIAVGSQPEFGSTPTWGSIEYLAHELGGEHLRLAQKDLGAARRSLGVTHVAVGAISGAGSRPTLSYRLYRTDTGAPVGPAVAVTGAPSAVRAGLPGVAQKLAQQLGVTAEPMAITDSAETLAALGAISRWPPSSLPKASAAALDRLQSNSAVGLAMMVTYKAQRRDRGLLVAFGGRRSTHWRSVVVAGEYSLQQLLNPIEISEHGEVKYLEPIAKAHPNNHILSLALAAEQVTRDKWDAARGYAENAIRCAPNNPFGWDVLSTICHEQSRVVRRDRPYDEMREEEMAYCENLYEGSLAYSARAVELDPRSSFLWVRLSQRATFAGQEDTARKALETALQLEVANPQPDYWRVYNWAFQLFQPKWYEDPQAAKRYGELAVAASKQAGNRWASGQRVSIAVGLSQSGQPALARAVLRNDRERLRLQQELASY